MTDPKQALDAIARLVAPEWPDGTRETYTPAEIVGRVAGVIAANEELRASVQNWERNEIASAVCCRENEKAVERLRAALGPFARCQRGRACGNCTGCVAKRAVLESSK